MEHPDVVGKQICLKLGSIDLKQSQLLSIKALIESMDASIAFIDTLSEQTEASAKTIAELSKKVTQNHEKIIFTLELSNTKIAQTIAQTTGSKIATWHSVHNVSQSDFESGKTYLDFMNENLNKLSEALHDRAKG